MVEDGKNRAKTFSKFLCEHEQLNKGQFGFGDSPKPKREIYLQLMDRARQDGLISDLHWDNNKIKAIAKAIADEFEKMEEPARQSNRDLFLAMFYDRIPKRYWGEPTYSTLVKYGLRKS